MVPILLQGYALVNGKRSVYISIAKAGDASTWDVVQKLKAELPKIQSTLPEDVKLSYEFDQSVYVINSVKSLITEGIIGAVFNRINGFIIPWRQTCGFDCNHDHSYFDYFGSFIP
jgi:multidrug efflux pump subunit AcrB